MKIQEKESTGTEIAGKEFSNIWTCLALRSFFPEVSIFFVPTGKQCCFGIRREKISEIHTIFFGSDGEHQQFFKLQEGTATATTTSNYKTQQKI